MSRRRHPTLQLHRLRTGALAADTPRFPTLFPLEVKADPHPGLPHSCRPDRCSPHPCGHRRCRPSPAAGAQGVALETRRCPAPRAAWGWWSSAPSPPRRSACLAAPATLASCTCSNGRRRRSTCAADTPNRPGTAGCASGPAPTNAYLGFCNSSDGRLAVTDGKGVERIAQRARRRRRRARGRPHRLRPGLRFGTPFTEWAR